MKLIIRRIVLAFSVVAVNLMFDARADTADATSFMHDVLLTYRAMTSYSDEGVAKRVMSSDGNFSMLTTFSTGFRRPGKFRFYWTNDIKGTTTLQSHDAIGSDGANVWSYFAYDHNLLKKQKSISLTVAAATGSSQGMAQHILALLTDEVTGVRFDQLEDLEIEKIDTLDGVDCLVVRGKFPTVPTTIQLWIGKSDHLVRKGVEHDAWNSVLTFEFKDIQIDQTLNDSQFSAPSEHR